MKSEPLNENGQSLARTDHSLIHQVILSPPKKTNSREVRPRAQKSVWKRGPKVSGKDFLKMSDTEFNKMFASDSIRNNTGSIEPQKVRKRKLDIQKRCRLCQEEKSGKRISTTTVCGLCERAICKEKHTAYLVCTKCAV